MKPGTYRLARIVENPRPGRRKSDWTQAPSWGIGLSFILKDEAMPMPEGYADRLELRLTRPDSLYSLPLGDVRTQALVPHLVELVEKPSDWLRRVERGTNMGPLIIDHLVASGRVTRADIEAAYDHCLNALFKKDA